MEAEVEEENKLETDDNAQTIRPTRSPQGPGIVPLPSATFSEPDLVEDYSDVLFDEDEDKLDKKVADFKVRCTGRATTLLF